MPARICRVVVTLCFGTFIQARGKAYADRVAARVAARIAERAELFEPCAAYASLFFQLAHCGIL
jgi:hypothetical protein